MEMERDSYDGRGDKYEDSPRERREGSELGEDEIEAEKSSRRRSGKDRRKGSSRGEDKDYHRSRDGDRERDQERSRDKRKDDRDERDKDKERSKEKMREKDYDREKNREKDRVRERAREGDKDKKNRGKDKERDRDREVDKERVKEKHRDRDRGREKEKERSKVKEREKLKDREEDREGDKDTSREKLKENIRDKEKERDLDHREKVRDRDLVDQKAREIEENDLSSAGLKTDHRDGNVDRVETKRGRVSHYDEDELHVSDIPAGSAQSASELQERISRMKEERLKKKFEGDSDILAWVNRSRKLEEKKKTEKEKALQLSRVLEEQDNIANEESDDDEAVQPIGHILAGVKVLHGLDKVAEGGAVVLTLKDQSILADGNINEEVDMLENVEIGEQKRRNEAYKAAKKKSEICDDKFNGVPGSERKILPQYDDPVAEEVVTLDAQGHFNSEAEKKLEELRRRLQAPPINNHIEDLSSSSVKVASDYYTHDEMLKFKKPKKKKALRKREKLDLDALEAEAVASGLGAEDLGSRNDGRRQAMREEQERSEAEKRVNAYQAAYAKAEEASKSLHIEHTLPNKAEEDESLITADDDDELYKSLKTARKLALKKQEEEATTGPEAIARLATNILSSQTANDQNPASGEGQDRVVFTEMEEFVWGLQLNEETRKPDIEDVFMDEDDAPKETDQEMKNEASGWSEVNDSGEEEHPVSENKEEIVPDETLVEPAVGKGLSGALKLLKERGSLKETIEWGGRNMDKKKSKLVGIVDNNEKPEKEIRIERTDEFGRILTPKEAFRLLSHKFHGKEPGKMKKEKRMKQYQEDLKLKQMKNSDTPSLSVERMREAQAKMKTPYLVLSGHVKPGQTSDPTSGFATVEKDGGLTPMLGDKKVEHFLGIKRKAEHGNSSGTPKKPKT